jgi:hypothetical protein
MGCAVAGKYFPVSMFPTLFGKTQDLPPPRRHPREHSLALGFACCNAYSLFHARQFHLPSLLQAYKRHASLLIHAGKLAPFSSSAENNASFHPPHNAPPQENTEEPPLPSLEPAFAWTLKHFSHVHSTYAFLEQNVRLPAPLPVLDGVLVRSLPPACFFYADAPARLEAIAEEALVTRTGALGALAAVALAALVANAISSPHAVAPAADLLGAMQRDMADVAPVLAKKGLRPAAVLEALSTINEEITCAQKDDPGLYAPAPNLHLHAGQLRTTFRLVLWELLHAPEPSDSEGPERAIQDVIRRGGSPASQGALVTALCGARWGKNLLPNPGLEPFAPLPPPFPPLPPHLQLVGPSWLEALAKEIASRE